jgi:SulP family sulfate permease
MILLFWPKVSRRIPGSLMALLTGTLLVQAFNLPVETIGSRFGPIPHTLPLPHWPSPGWHTLRDLIHPAMTIALLGAIESLLSATVADGMLGTRHRSNMELVAQGVANMASSLFGGIPATGAIARTATNIKNGGRTPVAGIMHAVTLLLIMLAFGRFVALIPLCALAAILLVVAYNMSEWRTFQALLRGPRSDVLVLLTTFTLTVAVDLTVAIEAGMILALFLFMKQMSEAVKVRYLTRNPQESFEGGEEIPPELLNVPQGVEVFEINGPLFFGAAQQFEEAIGLVARKPRVLIVRLHNLLSIDSTGLHALEQVHRNCARQEIVMVLSGMHLQPATAVRRSGLADRIGEENLSLDFDAAMARASEILLRSETEALKREIS